ncbi:MAG TPA: lysophospholipid acyltransferase family protein [Verrucomicrobiae bacterium]|nr:lysophospholipid acyltransferase family protein [Verrucomicrobiae bacterium]
MPARTRKSGVVVPHQAKWYQRLAARLIWLLIRVVSATIRFRLDDRSGFFSGAPTEKIIFALWHNRLALCVPLYQRYLRAHDPGRSVVALVSASRDGGLLAHILELFNIEVARGSSSRRGPQALRELVSWGENGYDLAITPDGPRGPCYTVQEGVVSTAQLTGLAIVPASYHLNWKIQLKSWDRFQIPLPFARCEVITGRVLRVPREASDAEREALRAELETEMRAITRD